MTVQFQRVELLFFETGDSRLPVRQQCQRRRHDAPHAQSLSAVQFREQARPVDSHEPVSLLTAYGRVVQVVIKRTVFQVVQTFPDGAFFHRRNPEPPDGFRTAALVIDQPKNRLAFPSRVSRRHNRIHTGILHERGQNFILFPCGRQHLILPFFGNNGQIVDVPPGIAGIVSVRRSEVHQVPDTPAYNPAAALQIPVVSGRSPCHFGNGLPDRGLFTDD